MLNSINIHKTANIALFQLHERATLDKFIDTKQEYIGGSQRLKGEGLKSYCIIGMEFLFLMMKNFCIYRVIMVVKHFESV